jgi:hypothetical protein
VTTSQVSLNQIDPKILEAEKAGPRFLAWSRHELVINLMTAGSWAGRSAFSKYFTRSSASRPRRAGSVTGLWQGQRPLRVEIAAGAIPRRGMPYWLHALLRRKCRK